MEIERKFLVDEEKVSEVTEGCGFHRMEQAYLCTEPVVRVRKSDERYILTCKSVGLVERQEYELPLSADAYEHLKQKADGIVIRKTRYLIPEKDGLTIELDVYGPPYEGLVTAEVEFPDRETAMAYTPPDWFGREVSYESTYHNSSLSEGRRDLMKGAADE